MFTKLDLWWSYNNVWIKEGNKWKVAFAMLGGLFKPIVMFFGLMNSLATFQAMMDKILGNLINTWKVTSFINDVIVRIEKEEGHDEVVKEVVKRLEKNNLYVKSEKCK